MPIKISYCSSRYFSYRLRQKFFNYLILLLFWSTKPIKHGRDILLKAVLANIRKS